LIELCGALQVARAGLELGMKKDDIVAVLMENEPAFVWTFYGERSCDFVDRQLHIMF
jgi:hypothetical protein